MDDVLENHTKACNYKTLTTVITQKLNLIRLCGYEKTNQLKVNYLFPLPQLKWSDSKIANKTVYVNRLRITNFAILQNNQGPWNHGISKTISP
jgi:hypothetical protein